MEPKSTISYTDFDKLDIRVGTVTECVQVPNSEKLLKLTVDLGDLGTRTILTGMAKWYTPADFINLQTLFIVNLEFRKMMGMESQGMLLSLGLDHNDKPILIKPNGPVKNGEGLS